MANTNEQVTSPTPEETAATETAATETAATETAATETAATEERTPTSLDVVEVEWENLQHIFEFREKVVNMENYFSSMCLQFEKNKANMLAQITYGENDLYSMAVELQKNMNVDTEVSYELKLPTQHGEKGYFLRKDQQP